MNISSNSSSSSKVLNTSRLKNPKLLLLESCKNLSQLKIIHGHMIRTHIIFDIFAASRLISLCTDPSFGTTLLDYAFKVLSQVETPNPFIYNALIKGFSASQNPHKSFHFYTQLFRANILPDNISFPFLVRACAQLESLDMGIQAHGQIIKHGFENNVYVQNSLVHMYSTCGDITAANAIFQRMTFLNVVSWTSMIAGLNKVGDVEMARKLFDTTPEKNLVTWSIMISGYAKNSYFEKAVELFQVLQEEGVQANETVMVSVISSCAHLGAIELGEKAHEYIFRNNLSLNVILGTALVDMYARCGNIEKAIGVLEGLPERDVLSWTALIAGLAMHGYAERALWFFSEMVKSGLKPRDISFTAVLSACSHRGLVGKVLELFESMKRDFGIEPRLEHYGCVVDLLGRAGKLAEAEKFVLEMPVKPNAPIWGALLGARRIHRNAEIAERVGKILIPLLPEHSG
ncbi:hypothetical protein QUC31_010395 [Theobroma cacao]